MKPYLKKIKLLLGNKIPKIKIIKNANLFIIGAQKCGTSTLFDNLVKHKNIYGGEIKEKNFFSHDGLYKKGVDVYHNMYPNLSILKKTPKNSYFLDASPSYLSQKDAAHKIFKYNPKAKFIVMMRNPVDRAFSAWNMYRQINLLSEDSKRIFFEDFVKHSSDERESKFIQLINLEKFPSFEEMVQDELLDFDNDSSKFPGILSRGIYFDQIECYFKFFHPSQFFFIFTEDFKVNKAQILNDLLRFLNLEQGLPTEKLKDAHVRGYSQKLAQDTREQLIPFFEPYNQKLFTLIDKQINWSK